MSELVSWRDMVRDALPVLDSAYIFNSHSNLIFYLFILNGFEFGNPHPDRLSDVSGERMGTTPSLLVLPSKTCRP